MKIVLIVCSKKGCNICIEKKLDYHHIIPKTFGGKDSDGRIYLCRKHHDILHKILMKFIWDFVPNYNKELCKDKIKTITKWWINKNE